MAEVLNGALRELVETMTEAGLSAQTIVTYSRVVKLVMASAVDDEGEQIHPRHWNNNFIGIPIINPNTQRRPTVSVTEVETAVASANSERYALLFALLAGTGLRIGEALAIKTGDLSPDCRVLNVRRSVWQGKEQQPKTPTAIRVVDIPEQLAEKLVPYVSGRSDYVFATARGRALLQRNVLRAFHNAVGRKVGFHALRRFRTEVLRKTRVPEDLVRLWLGHSAGTITDRYAGGLREDLVWRREWVDRAGLGFQLVHIGPQKVAAVDVKQVA